MGADGLDGGADVVVVSEFEEERQDGVAQEHEGADEAGVAGAGFVFEEEGVLAPVEAVFDAGPVTAHEGDPLVVGSFVGREAAEVEARFGGGRSVVLVVPAGLDGEEGACEGEAGGGRFDGREAQRADFDTAVGAVRLGKKGGSPLATERA